MKTAMQELIESIDIECKSRGFFINWDMYLAKERQQIEDAYSKGKRHAIMFNNIPNEPSDYYNKTYGHDDQRFIMKTNDIVNLQQKLDAAKAEIEKLKNENSRL